MQLCVFGPKVQITEASKGHPPTFFPTHLLQSSLLYLHMSLPPAQGISQTSGLAAESSLLAKALDGFWWASRPYLASRQAPGPSDGLHFVQGREAVHGRAAGSAALLHYDRGARALTMAFKGREDAQALLLSQHSGCSSALTEKAWLRRLETG